MFQEERAYKDKLGGHLPSPTEFGTSIDLTKLCKTTFAAKTHQSSFSLLIFRN